MRPLHLAAALSLVLAACDSGEPPKPAAVTEPVKPMVQAPAPTGDVATFNLVIDGDRMTGEWSMPGMGSGVTGRRIP